MEFVEKLDLKINVELQVPGVQGLTVPVSIKFPLPDGTRCVKGIDFGVKYNKYRLISGHNADFMNDPLFDEASRLATDALRGSPQWQLDIARSWNVYVCCWAASHAKNLPGDFVECGVHRGMISRAVIHYIDFNNTGKTFYLADTFCGIPEEQVTEEEKKFYASLGCDVVSHHNKHYYNKDCYDAVKETFKDFNVKLIRGKVPDTLPQIKAEKVCYLSIDMNTVAPEIAAVEYFWDRMVPGGIIILDDYGWDWHKPQKEGFDEFAKRKSVQILPLPTGQGLIIKP